MTTLFFTLLLLFALFELSNSTAIDVDINPIITSRGSHDGAEIFIQEETQTVNALTELDSQLTQQLSSGSTTILDVIISETVGSGSGSWIVEEVVMEIPTSELSENDKNELKDEIKSNVADTLGGIMMHEVEKNDFPDDVKVGIVDDDSIRKVQKLFEDEEQANEELNEMQNELEIALEILPKSGGPTEIDIVVTDDSDKNTIEEIVVVISASSGSGPRLMDDEKADIEEEIVEQVADTLGTIIMNDFLDTDESNQVTVEPHFEKKSYLENLPSEHTSPPSTREEVTQPKWKEAEPYAFRGAATAIAQPSFERPMFIPHHWQMPPDEQMWTMKLSILTCISCVTLLLIMGVWTQIRRARRRSTIDDSHFRWAEAVEYMDAFPHDL